MPLADLEKRRAYRRAYYLRNRASFLKRAKEYYLKNKKKVDQARKAWCQRNREKLKIFYREYARKRTAKGIKKVESSAARERRIARSRERFQERYKRDMNYTMLRVLRYRLWKVTTGSGYGRDGRTLELLGCTVEDFIRRIESQFVRGMTWSNYGQTWHIDHIIPCSAFDLTCPQQQRQCFHYTNLQPLWAKANIRKSNHIVDPQLSLLM